MQSSKNEMLKFSTLGLQQAGTPVFPSPGKDSAAPGAPLSGCLEARHHGDTKRL
jgi:hypothetical protein